MVTVLTMKVNHVNHSHTVCCGIELCIQKSAPLGERTLPEAVVDTIDKRVAAWQMCTESRNAEKLRVMWTKGIVPTFQ